MQIMRRETGRHDNPETPTERLRWKQADAMRTNGSWGSWGSKARGAILGSLVVLGVAGCDSATGPEDGLPRVSIAFQTTIGAAPSVAPGDFGRVARNTLAQSLTLPGSNGALTLDEVWMIVAEFELEREGDDACDDSIDHDSCEEFEAPPQFIQLPLDGDTEPTVSQAVPAGVYDELEFEIEDLKLDDDDEDAGEIQALFDAIRAQFPDWPEEASMLVIGTFTPTGGSAVAFRVFFKAEIEIEIDFDPPLDLTDGTDASVDVVVDPAAWFTRPDGTVMDLSQFEGQVVEFESEMENGFSEFEFDDDHDDGDDD